MSQLKDYLLTTASNRNPYKVRFKRIVQLSALLLFSFLSTNSVQAQEDDGFTRKGRWLVETGYNLITGLTSGGTGANVLVDSDGNTLTSFGGEIGKFTSENFALKIKFGLVSSGGFSITNFGAGGKYYAGGNVPIDFGVGLLEGGGTSVFQGNLGIGYAAQLAPNVTLEPSIGGLINDDGVLINFRIGFAMFL